MSDAWAIAFQGSPAFAAAAGGAGGAIAAGAGLYYARYAIKAQKRAALRHKLRMAEVGKAVLSVQAKGRANLARYVSRPETEHAAKDFRIVLGKAVHRAVADELGKEWNYSENRSFDYLHMKTRTKIELTTPLRWFDHVLRNPHVPVAIYYPDAF